MAAQIVHQIDRFNGVLVNIEQQPPQELETFFINLKEAISEWKAGGKRGLWITVQTSHSRFIPELTELGFDFHHAQPGNVCLTKWLPDDIPNHIPGYANHFLGVGGFVVNSQNQLLVIREKYQVLNNISLWKLPGGLADAGEDISDTARREVFEETGIETEFVCSIAFRHMHNYRHGCSDFYHVCLMRALTTEIKACPLEIAECRWMDIDEYDSLEKTTDFNRFIVKKYRDIVSSGSAIGIDQVLSFDKKSLQNVYSVHHKNSNLESLKTQAGPS